MNDRFAPDSSEFASGAFAALSADLNARINPERSRKFDRRRLEASRESLFALSRKLWPQLRGERLSVVGSNGKGSTAWYLSALAETHAPSPVGLYTSPHLSSVLERIRINREPVAARTALAGLERLRTRLDDPELYESFSYFEILTLLAFELFQDPGCPVQIFEAGLGGRFDATRLARAQTVVLTRIDLEHTQILGETPQAILREKLGMISPECRRVFYGPQALLTDIEIENEIRRLSADVQIHAWRPPESFADYLQENLAFARFILRESGRLANAERQTDIPPPPGRLEVRRLAHSHSAPNLPVYFDVAHNPASITRALSDIAARADFPGFDFCELRLGVLKDRDPLECLAAARAAGCQTARLLFGGELATPPDDLESAGVEGLRVLPEALEAPDSPALPASECRAVIVLGSHRIYNYFVELTTGGEKTDPDRKPQS